MLWLPSGSIESTRQFVAQDHGAPPADKSGQHSIFGPDGNTIIIALDDSAITGPEDGLRDMEGAIHKAIRNGANAILGFAGMFESYPEATEDVAGIMNLTLSTDGPHHLNKVQVGTVERAKKLGLRASGHINFTAPDEPHMLQMLGGIIGDCVDQGVTFIGHGYPRTIRNGEEYHYQDEQRNDPQRYAKRVRHGARILADLGADIIKVPFTGDADTFGTVVESTYGRPVVMAGGPLIDLASFLKNAHAAMEAGARGIAAGRNYFQRPHQGDDEFVLLALDGIVHHKLSVENAFYHASIIEISRHQEAMLGTITREEWGVAELPDGPGDSRFNPRVLSRGTVDELAERRRAAQLDRKTLAV